MKYYLLSIAFILSLFTNAQTVGLQNNTAGNLDNGYVLFAPISSQDTFLIDKCGNEVHRWSSNNRPGQSVYLLPDGDLLRTGNVNNQSFNAGGKGGLIERIDWNGNVVWSYTVASTTELQHHDVKMMPNGNILIISWELKTAAMAIAQGRNPAQVPNDLWSEKIIEVQPVGTNGGNIVWEWHLWDHLTQDFDTNKPNYSAVIEEELVDLNYKATANQEDWIHFNSVDYNAALDQIVISVHNFDEVWIIDHSTTTTQAASHAGGNSLKGGDLLYRWGNPAAYGMGTASDQKLYGQHNVYWIETGFPYAGQLMIFNNGLGRNFSSVEIIDTPQTGFTYNSTLPYLPASASYEYNAGNTENLYAQNISGSQLLSNGNVLICSGPTGEFIEVDTNGSEVWRYINPINGSGVINQGITPTQNAVFRATFYPDSYSAFNGRILTPAGTIESSNTVTANCTTSLGIEETTINKIELYPNPASDFVFINYVVANDNETILIYNTLGQLIKNVNLIQGDSFTRLDVSSLNSGIYLLKVGESNDSQILKLVVK
ncbi:putative secreted protein (Por secretion system target) [Nonlabens xylanidelens]|uniref:Putative secreted protein (Por secretion system target) n=1 Tax=Nonlabens xylanidelens TaxID=191564 RepID=A0A2S6IQY0_9FLAO|nr:aryl-sulfate sulfotransferase [Nonlabens xylanidelens]PPK96663.1 putative secreted protein (Por secretion system target) [Nonlabens xylanidelens]PQJ13378.1 hypothetical protein BST94_13515 [Nonlabens xylanidelens]